MGGIALGIATGGLVQTCVVALGLSSVFLLVPIVYETMKGIGAIYLIYLGTRILFSQQEAWADPGQEKAGATRVFLQGTFTTLLNPKAAFFYFALLPQFVDPTQGNEPLQLFMLGLMANMTGLAIESSIAYLASCFRKWLKAYVGTSRMLRWFTGSVFIGLGARLALSQ